MRLRAIIFLLAVVVVLGIAALIAGSTRRAPSAFAAPQWTAAVRAWLDRRQGVPAHDLRPWSSGVLADAACRDALAQRRVIVLPANGACAVFVAGSSAPVRSLVLRLDTGVGVQAEVDWVDRPDRLTEVRRMRPERNEVLRLPFYEEGGSVRITCPNGCALAVVTPGSA